MRGASTIAVRSARWILDTTIRSTMVRIDAASPWRKHGSLSLSRGRNNRHGRRQCDCMASRDKMRPDCGIGLPSRHEWELTGYSQSFDEVRSEKRFGSSRLNYQRRECRLKTLAAPGFADNPVANRIPTTAARAITAGRAGAIIRAVRPGSAGSRLRSGWRNDGSDDWN